VATQAGRLVTPRNTAIICVIVGVVVAVVYGYIGYEIGRELARPQPTIVIQFQNHSTPGAPP
jgi:hypothetical protein